MRPFLVLKYNQYFFNFLLTFISWTFSSNFIYSISSIREYSAPQHGHSTSISPIRINPIFPQYSHSNSSSSTNDIRSPPIKKCQIGIQPRSGIIIGHIHIAKDLSKKMFIYFYLLLGFRKFHNTCPANSFVF